MFHPVWALGIWGRPLCPLLPAAMVIGTNSSREREGAQKNQQSDHFTKLDTHARHPRGTGCLSILPSVSHSLIDTGDKKSF